MSHWYNKEGQLLPEGNGYPSVTTILSVRHNEGLQAWRDRMGAEEADRYKMERADVGTRVHKAAETWMKTGNRPKVAAELAPYLDGLQNWLDKYQPVSIKSEIFLFSELHEYAGTADLICEIAGEQWLIDFKTSKHINPEYALQLAAYDQAWYELGNSSSSRAVLQLTPDVKRGYRWKEFTGEDDFGVFMAHKTVFDWAWQTKRPQYSTIKWDSGILEAA